MAAPYPFGTPPLPTPTPRRSFSDRGPWWLQTLISAVVPVVIYAVSVPVLFAASKTAATDAGIWVEYVSWIIPYFLIVAIVAIWGRTLLRRVLAATAAAVLLTASHMVYASYDFDWGVVESVSSTTLLIITDAMIFLASILGWSIARRRTLYSLLGIIPAVGMIALGTWIIEFHLPAFDYVDDLYLPIAWWSSLCGAFVGFAVLGILLVWACDGLGLLLQRTRPAPPPTSPAFGASPLGTPGTPGQGTPWPGPSTPPPPHDSGWPPHQQRPPRC